MRVEAARVWPLGGTPQIAMLERTRACAGHRRLPLRTRRVARLGFGRLLRARMVTGMRVRIGMRLMMRTAVTMQRLPNVRSMRHLQD